MGEACYGASGSLSPLAPFSANGERVRVRGSHLFGSVPCVDLSPGKRTAPAFSGRRTYPPKAKLWAHLRNRRLGGFKFLRQVPIGPYYADFLCREARLIIEVDGGTHSKPDEIAADRQRQQELERIGYRIVRVWNGDVSQTSKVSSMHFLPNSRKALADFPLLFSPPLSSSSAA